MEKTISMRPGVGATAQIIQRQALRFTRLFNEQPVLIVVEQGEKHLAWPGGETLIREGEAVALAGGSHFDVTNRPEARGGYRARWFAWGPALLAAAPDAPPIRELLAFRPSAGFLDACQRAHTAIVDADAIPDEVASHRMAELLVWLAHFGGMFVPAHSPSLMRRVWRLFDTEPGRNWDTDAVSAALAMSEATLRRRLSGEGATLSGLLTEVRMTRAMQLLQSTGLPITQIALEVGYESASRFAMRFRSRFGFAPTAVRGHKRADTAPTPRRARRRAPTASTPPRRTDPHRSRPRRGTSPDGTPLRHRVARA
jgi:AraC-like DNA-binding protein